MKRSPSNCKADPGGRKAGDSKGEPIGIVLKGRGLPGALLALLFLLVALSASPTVAQPQIRGMVLDEESREPLPGANVFLDETTIGAATDTLGLYRLDNLPPGPYTVVASMVGYETEERDVILQEGENDSRRIDFELTPRPVQLRGVTVEDNRDEWLGRLSRFRSSFFGEVPNAGFCELLNPEVLSFEQTEEGLVARAEEPLRVRNEALGYELTYHLSRFVASPSSRARYGHVEFDTLRAESEVQRREWAEARKRAYLGSFRHFIDALVAGAFGAEASEAGASGADVLRSEGFEVGLTSISPSARDRERTSGLASAQIQRVSTPSEILEPAPTPQRVVLTVPRGKHLEVEYAREGEHKNFARRFRRGTPRSSQRSWVMIEDGSKVLIETQSGDFVRQKRREFGHYVLEGYWGWVERAPTALPERYRPAEAP